MMFLPGRFAVAEVLEFFEVEAEFLDARELAGAFIVIVVVCSEAEGPGEDSDTAAIAGFSVVQVGSFWKVGMFGEAVEILIRALETF